MDVYETITDRLYINNKDLVTRIVYIQLIDYIPHGLHQQVLASIEGRHIREVGDR